MFLTFRWSVFSVPVFAVSEVEGTKKSAISGTLLNEDGDIALRMLSVNLITYGLCFFTLR